MPSARSRSLIIDAGREKKLKKKIVVDETKRRAVCRPNDVSDIEISRSIAVMTTIVHARARVCVCVCRNIV